MNAAPYTDRLPTGTRKTATIVLSDAGKRFNRDWIFRHVTVRFEGGKSYAITGPNGSGKSTLLQTIGGSLLLNEGSLQYTVTEEVNNGVVEEEHIYREIALAAPYLELIEEMSAREFLQFHHRFKPLAHNYTTDQILEEVELLQAADKQIRYYSSGMKQRVKLAQAIFSDVPVVLLDEPCTNLDKAGYDLYHRLIAQHCQRKLVIVSSNDQAEMDFCHERLSILDFK